MFVFLVFVYILLQLSSADVVSFVTGTWTSPVWDNLANQSMYYTCCIPDNVTFAPLVENGTLINVTYRFSSTNLACQAYFMDSEAHIGSWNASLDSGLLPDIFLEQHYVTTWQRWVNQINYMYGQSSIYPLYLRVFAEQMSFYCSFYMTNKLNESADSINMGRVESSTPSILNQQISTQEIEDLLSRKVQPYLVSILVFHGILGILVLIFSLIFYRKLTPKTRISSQKTVGSEEMSV